jgi:hypothetical protein
MNLMRFSAASLVASLLLLAPVSAPADPAAPLSRSERRRDGSRRRTDDFAGLSAAQLQTLIAKSQQVEAAINGFMKCGSGAPGLSSKSTKHMFTIFALEIASATTALAKV